MSFLHNVKIGVFSDTYEQMRSLELDECQLIVEQFKQIAPKSFNFLPEQPKSGDLAKGVVLGRFDGFPLVLKNGMLTCPYLSTRYHVGAIAFAVYMTQRLNCRILSLDDGRFLSLEEFIPKMAFSEIMQSIKDNRDEADYDTD